MNITDVIKKGTDAVRDGIKDGAEKLQDKDFRKETAKKVLKAAEKAITSTAEYVDEKRLIPGAKDKYIAELEQKIAMKDHEIFLLKSRLKRETWGKHKKSR